MKLFQNMTTIRKYLPLYLMTIILAFVMRYVSKINDSDALCWILTPTALWVSVLSGIRFEYLPHMGYVNYFYRFLIAPTCSGCRFMLIIFLMLIFSFLYRIKSARLGYMWFGFSIIFSYVFTIFVNGIRITASIYVPIALENLEFIGGLLTQDRLHTIIGTATYFSFMCAAYPLADFFCRRVFMHSEINFYNETCSLQQGNAPKFSLKLIIPAFWYILTVLVIPFIGRVYRNDWDGFGQYAALIIGVCLVIAAIRQLTSLFLYVIYYFRQLPK
ncbi:MAG: exosortase K [Lachnospiraceae bacterium]|nr:exosortase K [Lachnospiraceae bacterium]